MKSKFYSFTLFLFLLLTSTASFAQKRDKMLNIEVTTNAGISLAGQLVDVEQTDYQLQYPETTLDADGKCSLKVYAGNNKVTVKRDGFNTATATVNIAANETGKDVKLQLVELTRDPFALNAVCTYDAYTGKNQVKVTWNTEKPAFFDDFESYDPFSINFGDWTGIDADHLMTAPLTGDYPNRGVFQYAQIMNPLKVDPMWYYDYPTMRAYSGKQYVGFVRTNSGEPNDDWLISPEITVGTDNILSFYAMAADKYIEKFVVYITTQTNNPTADDFVQLTKGNYETADYKKNWQLMQYDLAEYAQQKVKIAIRYIGDAASEGAFMLKLDDFHVGQSTAASYALAPKANRVARNHKSPANPNETFDIYLDNQKVGKTGTYSYVLYDVAEGTHTIGVKANYIAAQSQLVTTTIEVSKSAYASLTMKVAADSKLSADGTVVNLLSTDNGTAYQATVANGVAKILMLPKGKYTVNVEKGAFKAYSKEIDLQADQTLDINLEDDVITPYNITADMNESADGISVKLNWNQILGFSDSFETYDDFATGQFGDWKSVDLDQTPVYPIGLGSTSNIVTFPGSGDASNPKAIAPIVFNPWNTVPAMLPTDMAMQAPDGNKYVVFFSPQGAQADKWLISPLIDIYDGYELKVTAKSYTDMYNEKMEFAVSETGSDNPDDFVVLSNAQNIPSDQWTVYSTDLAPYAGKKVRLAVHYTSTDAFFAQLDLFKAEPADGSNVQQDYGNVLHYNIYIDGSKYGESTTPSFTIDNLPEGSYTIGIEAVYKNAVSEMATYQIVVSGIDVVSADTDANAQVYNLAGQKLNARLHALPQGVYIVKDANGARKVRK